MSSRPKDEILEFLSQPVPGTGGKAWVEWKSYARSLGPEASSVLLGALATGSENEQYAALLSLREIGYEAWGKGYGRELSYEVRKIGELEWEVIKPLHPPDDDLPGEWVTGTKP